MSVDSIPKEFVAAIRRAALVVHPFPHAVIDDALPGGWLKEVLHRWPDASAVAWKGSQKHKQSMTDTNSDDMPPIIRQVLLSGNASSVVNELSRFTGITGLIPDSSFAGAGIHEVSPPGFLRMHVDFNRGTDPTTGQRSLYRRLNMMLYLNRGWQPEWNGALELRKNPASEAGRVVIEPRFNRLVIFESSERSWHGHPQPLACPEGVSRKSLAWYFYTAEPPPDYREDHSTKYVK